MAEVWIVGALVIAFEVKMQDSVLDIRFMTDY